MSSYIIGITVNLMRSDFTRRALRGEVGVAEGVEEEEEEFSPPQLKRCRRMSE